MQKINEEREKIESKFKGIKDQNTRFIEFIEKFSENEAAFAEKLKNVKIIVQINEEKKIQITRIPPK